MEISLRGRRHHLKKKKNDDDDEIFSICKSICTFVHDNCFNEIIFYSTNHAIFFFYDAFIKFGVNNILIGYLLRYHVKFD